MVKENLTRRRKMWVRAASHVSAVLSGSFVKKGRRVMCREMPLPLPFEGRSKPASRRLSRASPRKMGDY